MTKTISFRKRVVNIIDIVIVGVLRFEREHSVGSGITGSYGLSAVNQQDNNEEGIPMRLGLLRGMIDRTPAVLSRKFLSMTSHDASPSSHAVSQTIVSMGRNEEDDPTAAEVFEFVDGLSPETLRLLENELRMKHAERVHSLVTDLVYNDKTSHHVREAKLREYLILIDDNDREDLDMNLALIEGLHCMPLLEQHPDMTQGDAAHVNLCKAMIKVARAAVSLEDERGIRVHDQEGVVFLTEPALIRLIIEHPDRAEQIAEFITSRHELHPEAIAELIHTTPPLAPGTL